MQLLEVHGKQLDVTEAIQEHVAEKLTSVAKLTEKFEPCDVRVNVGKEAGGQAKGDVFSAEFLLSIPGANLRAEVKKDDLYAAIDLAVKELRRQVKDFKEKMIDADRVAMDTEIEETTTEF